MRVLLIDDEELALDVNEIMLNELEGIEVVGKFTDPYEALVRVEELRAEVILLDMELGEIHGLELAEMIMNKYSHIEILFVTAHPQYALEAFEVNATDYLLKPVGKARLKKAIEKTKEKLELYKGSKNLTKTKKTNFYAHTMGDFQLLNSQQTIVKWRTKKVKELFLYLWQNRGNAIHKAIVMEQLWPEADMENPSAILHTTVYQLRKTLKDNGIENSLLFVNDHYALNVEIDSDYSEIEELLITNKKNAMEVEQLLSLYDGDYLEEEDYQWAISTQQRMKRSVLQYLERVVSEDRVDHTLLENCLEKMLKLDMYNETYMYKLLFHYSQSDNSQKMKTFYQTIVVRLQDDLGIDVSNEIQLLYRQKTE